MDQGETTGSWQLDFLYPHPTLSFEISDCLEGPLEADSLAETRQRLEANSTEAQIAAEQGVTSGRGREVKRTWEELQGP
jgi:hypothetical protein